uniref:Uncharacterized protein n=1 Tax=Trichobilharzia regenti TaxID=157069 RepID=A0AA85IZL2_TRIRE|nr:unnamed protein product [Trichobilharzia regenti]CAH8863060.1 unnamed protein product [Trichobilharzia regenti]
MNSMPPSVVSNLMRQPIHHLHMYAQNLPSILNLAPYLSLKSIKLRIQSQGNSNAEVLRLSVHLLDDICLSRLIVPFTELIKAGGGSSTASIGASSATGGSRGTGVIGSASVATATCVFIHHLATANASALAISPKTNTCLRCATSKSQTTSNGLDNPTSSPVHKMHNSPPSSSHSSPSSLYGVSPPTPPTGSVNEVNSGATDISTSGSRSRAMLHVQKHTSLTNGSACSPDGMGLSSTVSATQLNSTCCNSTVGGFASVAPHTGKLLVALLSAPPGACRHPNSSGKIVQEEMA